MNKGADNFNVFSVYTTYLWFIGNMRAIFHALPNPFTCVMSSHPKLQNIALVSMLG